MKSFKDTQPDFGVAREGVDVQRYVEGRSQVCAVAGEASKTLVKTRLRIAVRVFILAVVRVGQNESGNGEFGVERDGVDLY